MARRDAASAAGIADPMSATAADRDAGIGGGRLAAVAACLVPAAYFAAVAGFALVHAEDYAADLPRLARYVLAPGAIALTLAAAALRLSPRKALVAGTSATAMLCALFAFEAVLTVRGLQASLGTVGDARLKGDDTRFRSALPPTYTLKALNASLGVRRLDAALLGSAPHVDVLLCARGGVPVTYRADRYGFNNDDAAYDRPVRTLVLGDSFVEGMCLPRREALLGQLARLTDGTIGLGTRGAGPLVHLATLGRYGPKLKPRTTVITFFAGNDWENLANERTMPWLRPALARDATFGPPKTEPAMLRRARAQVAGWWTKADRGIGEVFARRKVVRNFLALQQTALHLGLHYPKAQPDLPEFEQILRRMREIAAGWDGGVVLVYVPPVDRYAGVLDARFVHDRLRHRVLAASGRADVPVIDLAAAFDGHENPNGLYAPDSHFSTAGAKMAARVIADGVARATQAASAVRPRPASQPADHPPADHPPANQVPADHATTVTPASVRLALGRSR